MILTNTKKKSLSVDDLLREVISSRKIDELLLIVPTNRRIRHLKKLIIDNSPESSVTKINLHTLGTFAGSLLGQQKKYSELSEAAASLFIKKSSENTELKYFTNFRGAIPYGTLTRIRNVISRYKENGITPEILNRESVKLPLSERLKSNDIAEIFSNYNSRTNKINALELGDIYKEITNLSGNFEIYFRRLFPDVSLTVITGFDSFTALERKILKSISQIKSNNVFVEFDYYQYNPTIFSEVRRNINALIESGYKQIFDTSENHYNSFVKNIRSNLFDYSRRGTALDYSGNVKIIRCFDREHEVNLIAKEIKNLISDQGADPSSICVAFNLIENYSNHVRFSFDQFGLPHNLTDRTPLSDTYPVSAILNYLEIAEGDFYYKNISRAFKSGFIDTFDIDIPNILKVARRTKVVKGFRNWINSIERELIILSNEDELYFEKDKSGLQKAKNDLEMLHADLKPFYKKLTIKEFWKELLNTIQKLSLPSLVIKDPVDNDERNIKALTTFIDTLEEIFSLLSEEYPADAKFDLTFYLDQLRTACRYSRFNIKEKTEFGILVTTINEIRGLKFDYLFLGGMVDGDFPTKYSPEIFSAENYSKKEHEHITEERYLFYQALKVWDKGLIFSLPSSEESKDFSESSFLREFKRLIRCSELNEKHYKNFIYSSEELQYIFKLLSNSAYFDLLSSEDKCDSQEINNLKLRIETDKIRESGNSQETIFTGFINAQDKIDTSGNGLQYLDSESQNHITANLQQFLSKEYSASELELYAKCPYKYFLERVLRLEFEGEPTEEIEAVELGSLLHAILFEFYTAIRSKGIRLSSASKSELKESVDLIFKIAEKYFQNSAFESPLSFYDVEKLLGINSNRENSILYRFIMEELKDNDYIPGFFEASFGSSFRDKFDKELDKRTPVEIDGVKLKGKIDRIEISVKDDSFSIVDYKLNKSFPPKNDLLNGTSLQLPLYLMCAKALLQYKFNKVFNPAFMYIFTLKYSIKDFGKHKLKYGRESQFDADQFNKEIVELTRRHIKKYVSLISEGKFPVSQLEDRKQKVCNWCDFRSVCRVEEFTF